MKRLNSILMALVLIMVTVSFVSAATVTADIAGNGQGYLNSSSPIICTGNTCTVTFPGDNAAIVANADAGSIFIGWTGCEYLSGVNNTTCTVTNNTVSPVTATFVAITNATVTAVAGANGTLGIYAGSNASIGCVGSVCTVSWNDAYPYTDAYIQAIANTGYVINTWTGCDSVWSTNPSVCVVSRSTVSPVTATFVVAPPPMSTKIGVFRKGSWYLDSNGNGVWNPGVDASIPFGLAGDIPVTGNWNGSADGKSKIGVFRNGTWYLDYPGTGAWVGCGAPGNIAMDACYTFGIAGDIPVTGNWNGSADGQSKIGVFRKGSWYLDGNGDGVWDPGADPSISFGIAGDIPVTGNWNGSADGKSKIGVFRNGTWYLDYPGTGVWVGCGAPANPAQDACIPFGLPGDVPVVGDWNASGTIKIGVFRPSTGTWYLDYNGNGTWDGCGAPGDITKDACYTFGMTGDSPVTGAW